MFIDPVEDQRRDERGENAAHHTAGGHDEKIFGEPGGGRAIGRQRAVQAGGDDQQQQQRGDAIKGGRMANHHQPGAARQQQRDGGDGGGDAAVPGAAGGKDEDEGEEIGPERQHPQQRHRHDVGGDVGGGGEHQARWHGGQQQPVQPAPPGDGTGAATGYAVWQGGGRAIPALPDGECAPADEQRQQDEAGGPQGRLEGERGEGFQQEGIGDEAQQRADVGRGIEEEGAGGGRIGGAGEPGLHQRRLRGDRDEYRADGDGQQPDQPQGRRIAGGD